MRKFLSLLFCLSTITSVAQKHKSTVDKRFTGLDTAFARVLKDWHAAGFAVAVVVKDKVVYAKGFGYKDYEGKVPVTPNTLFAIGSCTKAFTASLVGMLDKDGKVDIDKPVRNYIPELKFYNDEMNDHITLRDMMCHRTGLPRHDISWYLFPTHSKDSLMQRIRYMEPSAGIREKWQYNNFMFMMQGLVVEKLTGKSWEDNIREKIFTPLGMNNSDVSLAEWTKSSDEALGYDVKDDSILKKQDHYDIAAMSPAGSINSCVTDMAKWVSLWIAGGKLNGKEIIPPSYVKDAITVQMATGGGVPDKAMPEIYFSGYGFGWFLSSYRGHYRVEHGGNIDGFSASTCFYPTDSIGIIVLTNQNGSPVPSAVRNLVSDKMLGLKYYDWETYLKNSSDSAKAKAKAAESKKVRDTATVVKPSHILKDYEGLYSNPGYGTFEITLKNDSFFIKAPKMNLWLQHKNYDIFNVWPIDDKDGIDTTGVSFPAQFNTGLSGYIESASINLEPTVKPIVFTRSSKEIVNDSLQAYTGEYQISTVMIKIYTKADSSLYMFVTGQPEYQLIPIDKDKFALKNLNGFSVQFNRNDKNEVTELLSIQPNGTFKAKKK
jgi:CubicO group peptidase (beta-lactamase class C family)